MCTPSLIVLQALASCPAAIISSHGIAETNLSGRPVVVLLRSSSLA